MDDAKTSKVNIQKRRNTGGIKKNTIIRFTPKGGEKDIIDLCTDGQKLKLWPRIVSYRYYIYRPGNPDVGGKVSIVPDKYTDMISAAKDAGNIVNATFSKINNKGKIKIEIYSKEASESWLKRQNDYVSERLSEKYSPKKSIICSIYLNADHRLRCGDSIFLRDKPVEYYANAACSGGIVLNFYDNNGREIGRLNNFIGIQERILRAKYNGYVLDIKILNINEQNKYVAEIRGHIEGTMEIKFIKRC